MQGSFWVVETEFGPVIATAIHAGHSVREEIEPKFAISEEDRLREEDPFTDIFTWDLHSRIIVNHSRFEVDLNRPRDKAVYQKPEDAWGLEVWKTALSEAELAESLRLYDAFYDEMKRYFDRVQEKYGNFVVLDIHAYNHHRQGPDAPFDDPLENPDINVGTRTLKNPEKWRHMIDGTIAYLKVADFLGKVLDVRENVKFGGGYFAEWIHENYAPNACVLSLEFKKFFMDEWTGKGDEVQIRQIRKMVGSLLPLLERELGALKGQDGTI